MKLKKRILAFFISCLLLITGCSGVSLPTNADTAFENFTLCLFQQEVASNTLNLHYSLQNPEKYGIKDTPITFGSYDFQKESALAAVENLDTALHKFSYNALSKENQLTYDILLYYFTNMKTDISYYLYDEPLSPVTGIHAQLPVLLAEYHFCNSEDVDTYLRLLQTLPDFFASLIQFEQQKASAGLFMSDALANEVIAQCHAFVSMGENNYLLTTFEERLVALDDVTSGQRTTWIQKNKEVLSSCVVPAYQSLATCLSNLKGAVKDTQGLCFLPNGKAYYEHLVAMDTASSRSITELKTMIQNQIATDLLDSQRILQKHTTLSKATDSITESPDTILKILETKISDSFPAPAPVNVEIKYVPSALEAYLSPAFYLIPSIDNFTQNVIYINQAHSMDNIHLFTTLAHEGYPGHLYQTTYFANTNPDPIRTLLSFNGYVEGWATYAEMCSYYISPLEKSYATLLQKNNSLILGLYAMTDIGIHYEGWSLDDTIVFFTNYGIDDEETIQEIYRYIVGDPANYLMYYIGYLEILELKKNMIAEKGSAFSQKEFHQRLIELGPAPFEIIRKYMSD